MCPFKALFLKDTKAFVEKYKLNNFFYSTLNVKYALHYNMLSSSIFCPFFLPTKALNNCKTRLLLRRELLLRGADSYLILNLFISRHGVSSHNVIFHKKSILSDIASDKVEELICQKQS